MGRRVAATQVSLLVLAVSATTTVVEAQSIPSAERVAVEAFVSELDRERPPSHEPPRRTYASARHEVRWLLNAGASTTLVSAGLLPLALDGCDRVAPSEERRFRRSTGVVLGLGLASLTAGLLRLAFGGVERRRERPPRGRRVAVQSVIATLHAGVLALGLIAANAGPFWCNS